MPAIEFTLSELLALHDNCREAQSHGRAWDGDGISHPKRAFMRRVLAAIVAAQKAGKAVLELEEADLWQIDDQIPSGLMRGTDHIGYQIVLKIAPHLAAMEAVEAAEPDAPGESAVPGVFEGAFAADDENRAAFDRWMAEREQGQ